ncbi:hypothetical protein [Candidatus Binatus sp.]|uniref:hypothetical protein n=1 Tax=Candidatus Binatus sp. TaxID=2811406 RepID=UPI003F979CF4
MIRRIGITIVATLLAVFGIPHVRAFVTHGQFDCAAASAQQDWDDGGSGAAESDEASTEPATKTPPPDITGEWSGELDDVDRGTHDFSVDVVDQKGAKVSGTWSGELGTGDWSGSINSEGDLKANFKIEHGCHLKAVGMLLDTTPAEISGTYKVENCGKALKHDHGTFELTD